MDHTCNDYWLTRLSVCWYSYDYWLTSLSVCWYSYGYWLTRLSVCWYSYGYWLTRLSVCWYSYGYWLTRLSVCWYSYDYWLTRLSVCWYSYLCLHARLGVAYIVRYRSVGNMSYPTYPISFFLKLSFSLVLLHKHMLFKLPHVCSCEVIQNMDLLNGHLSLKKYYTTCRK